MLTKFISWLKSIFVKPPMAPSAEDEKPLPSPPKVPVAAGLKVGSRDWYRATYPNAFVWPLKKSERDRVVSSILVSRNRYEAVSAKTGVPWWAIAVIHHMESDRNFATVLHNGEKLTDVNRRGTVLVPKGLGKGKNWTWEDAAIDALTHDGLPGKTMWDIGNALETIENYNGRGYRNRGLPSAYLWASTNVYTKGRFVSDGKWDPNAVSTRIAVVAILKGLEEKGLISF